MHTFVAILSLTTNLETTLSLNSLVQVTQPYHLQSMYQIKTTELQVNTKSAQKISKLNIYYFAQFNILKIGRSTLPNAHFNVN